MNFINNDTFPQCGFIAVIGAPNAGKSTLINQFVGAKVTIVSPKVQTTRRRILGITINNNSQLIFIDTPGIFSPQKDLEKAMVKEAWNAPQDADICLVMFDAKKDKDIHNTMDIIERAKQANKNAKIILALNKVDVMEKTKLLQLAKTFSDADKNNIIDRVFMISALEKTGCNELLEFLTANVPECPWMYPEDQISDLPQRQLAAEITREYLFKFMHQEIPYSITVETDSWERKGDGSVKITQTIFTNKPGHRQMILGKNGDMIKRIGQTSRHELEEIFGHKIHLFLNVKVDKNWLKKPKHFSEMGLEFERKNS